LGVGICQRGGVDLVVGQRVGACPVMFCFYCDISAFDRRS
jgi:hypothetical protein